MSKIIDDCVCACARAHTPEGELEVCLPQVKDLYL